MKFEIVVKNGPVVLMRTVGMIDYPKTHFTEADATELIDTEKFLEKITGLRFHINQLPDAPELVHDETHCEICAPAEKKMQRHRCLKHLSDQLLIVMADLCKKHSAALVHGAGYTPDDPWRVLTIAAQIALFQAATTSSFTHQQLGGDMTRLPELGCLACYMPEKLDEIITVAKSRDIGQVKALGEKWVEEARR